MICFKSLFSLNPENTSLPAATMLIFVSRGHWRDSARGTGLYRILLTAVVLVRF